VAPAAFWGWGLGEIDRGLGKAGCFDRRPAEPLKPTIAAPFLSANADSLFKKKAAPFPGPQVVERAIIARVADHKSGVAFLDGYLWTFP
jgi:hypothetical protein